jgi:hypothetical protein
VRTSGTDGKEKVVINIWAVVATFIKEELELIKRTGESRNAKSHGGVFQTTDAYHEIISTVKELSIS